MSGCGRCPLPAGSPSCQGQRCCPSSAWWGPIGGEHDTLLPTAMGYSWAPLSWQPFSTATGLPFSTLSKGGEMSEQQGREGRAEEGKEGKKGWMSSGHRGHCELCSHRHLSKVKIKMSPLRTRKNLWSPQAAYSKTVVLGFCALLVVLEPGLLLVTQTKDR